MEKRKPFFSADGNVNWCGHYIKHYGGFLKTELHMIQQSHSWAYIWRKLIQKTYTPQCSQQHNLSQLRHEKWPKCPLTDERIKKMWYIHIVCIYIHIYVCVYDGILLSHKKNETMPFSATCIDLKVTILSEVSQRKPYNTLSFTCGI